MFPNHCVDARFNGITITLLILADTVLFKHFQLSAIGKVSKINQKVLQRMRDVAAKSSRNAKRDMDVFLLLRT